MIRLTTEQAESIGYKKITDWFAIRPIELKDGSYILPKEVLPYIEKFLAEKVPVEKTTDDVYSVLRVCPVRKLNLSELKVVEPIEREIIKKTISI